MNDNYIEVEGKLARIINLFDEDDQITDDPSLACKVLIQFDEDRRPDGVDQEYYCQEIPVGSLCKVVEN